MDLKNGLSEIFAFGPKRGFNEQTRFKMIVDETGMEAIVTRECMGILCIVMVVFGALMYFFVENALARQITLK